MSLNLDDPKVEAPFEVKTCTKCHTTRPVSDFRLKTPEGPRKSHCRYCTDAYGRQWRTDNPDKIQGYNLRHNPNSSLPLPSWERKMADQDGRCAICRKPERKPRRKRLSVDHDHVTGVRRGLLCDDCNNLLGRAHDNPEILLAAVAYLAKWSN